MAPEPQRKGRKVSVKVGQKLTGFQGVTEVVQIRAFDLLLPTLSTGKPTFTLTK